MKKLLGRVYVPDKRDRKFAISAKKSSRRYRYWNGGSILDQNQKPSNTNPRDYGTCVGQAWAGWLLAPPISQFLDPVGLYDVCKFYDDWRGECVDMETQCLTERGWLFGNEVLPGDRILGFDLEAHGLRWMEIEKVHRFENSLYRIWKNKNHEVAVTDNHKWLLTSRNRPWLRYLKRTDELQSKDAMVLGAPSIEQPDSLFYEDNLVEAVAWCITEGYFRPAKRRGNGIVVSQKTHKEKTRSCLTSLGAAPGHLKKDGCHTWEICGIVAAEIRRIVESPESRIAWLQELTQRQLSLFVDTCILADGCTTKQEGNRKERKVFCQLPGPTLDMFLSACTLLGISVGRARIDKISGTETWTIRKTKYAEIRALKPSLYQKGEVWCPQTKLQTFVARRKGRVFLTGNSYEGTSVRAGAKVLEQLGFIYQYNWAFNIDALVYSLLELGPVVVGTNWYSGMDNADRYGYINVAGSILGGHAYRLTGINTDYGVIRMDNSWSASWGIGGRAWITIPDFKRLLEEDGEVCLAEEAAPHI